jgi:hypothetical protein
MNTSETVAKLTGAGMQNSYLMTYMSSIREELAKSGLELNSTVVAQLGALRNTDGTPSDRSEIENNEEVAAIAKKFKEPEFEEGLKQTYKAKMLEILELLEIELTPEIITEFKAEVSQNPTHFTGLFASAL